MSILNHYRSKAEEALLATKVVLIYLPLYFRPIPNCSSGTQGVGGNIEDRFQLGTDMGRQAGLLFDVDDDRCFGCAACVALCPVNALTLEGLLAIIDEPTCTHCEHCIPACPVHALSLVREEKDPVYEVHA